MSKHIDSSISSSPTNQYIRLLKKVLEKVEEPDFSTRSTSRVDDSQHSTTTATNLPTLPASDKPHGVAAAYKLSTSPTSDIPVSETSTTADVLSSSPTFSTSANNIEQSTPLNYAQQYDAIWEHLDLLRSDTRALISID